MAYSWRNFKVITYALIGAGVMGVGLNLILNLDKIIVLPFFPDILDAASIIVAGSLLLREVCAEASKAPR